MLLYHFTTDEGWERICRDREIVPAKVVYERRGCAGCADQYDSFVWLSRNPKVGKQQWARSKPLAVRITVATVASKWLTLGRRLFPDDYRSSTERDFDWYVTQGAIQNSEWVSVDHLLTKKRLWPPS